MTPHPNPPAPESAPEREEVERLAEKLLGQDWTPTKEEIAALEAVVAAAPDLMDACVGLAQHLPMKKRNHGDAWLAMHHALAALATARPGEERG